MSRQLKDLPDATEPVPALRCSSISVHFGGVAALTDVSMELMPTDVTAVVGPNGAGKTTLLNAITGLSRPTSGTITICGDRIARTSPSQVARRGVGRSYQDPVLVGDMSVMQNVMLGAHNDLSYGMLSQWFRQRRVRGEESRVAQRAEHLLKLCGLDEVHDTPVNAVPYGTRKLVDIARALMLASSLLLLDEPSSGVGKADRSTVQRIINDVSRRQKIPILLIEHHLDVVRQTAHKVLALQGGMTNQFGPTTEVLNSAEFRELLTGDRNRPARAATSEDRSEP